MKCLYCNNILRKTKDKLRVGYTENNRYSHTWGYKYLCLFHGDIVVEFICCNGCMYEVFLYNKSILINNDFYLNARSYYCWIPGYGWENFDRKSIHKFGKLEFNPKIIDKIEIIMLFS